MHWSFKKHSAFGRCRKTWQNEHWRNSLSNKACSTPRCSCLWRAARMACWILTINFIKYDSLQRRISMHLTYIHYNFEASWGFMRDNSSWVGKVKQNEERQKQSTALLMQWHPLNRSKWAWKTNANLKAQSKALDLGPYIWVTSYEGSKISSWPTLLAMPFIIMVLWDKSWDRFRPMHVVIQMSEYINSDILSPFERSSATKLAHLCLSLFHPYVQVGILRHPHLQIKQIFFCNK